MYDSNIVAVHVNNEVNFDYWYLVGCITGNALRLTEHEAFNKKGEKNYYGLQSEFFGTDFSDDAKFSERWSCRCHRYIGNMYKGKICEWCGTPVIYQHIDMKKYGWVVIERYPVISPTFYSKLQKAFGSSAGDKVINKILKVKYSSKDDEEELTEQEYQESLKHPFMYKGMIWFYEHFDEVINYYKKKKPTQKALFDELLDTKDCVFTHCIPIYTAAIRTEVPGEKGGKLFKLKINTIFQTIIRLANTINKYGIDDSSEIQVSINKKLFAIQKELGDLFEMTYMEMTGKEGYILSRLSGGRYNFSARNIVINGSGKLRTNEIEIGYITFMELFRYEITKYYMNITGCSPKKANTVWKKGLTHYNSTLHEIMQYMTRESNYKKMCTVMISRNPMINYGSSTIMHIVNVKGFEDKTMTIPSAILTPSNGDHDGDMYNIFRIPGADLIKRFAKTMDPRYNLPISRIDGKINTEVAPIKNELVGFWAFNNL